MPIKFTEEQLMIRDMVRDFTAREIAPRDQWMDENGFDRELFTRMVDAGILTVPYPAEYGGAGCNFTTCTMVIEEIAKGSGSMAITLDSTWLASDLILCHGSEDQKKKYIPEAAAGKIFCFALTEPGAGSDAAAIRSTAVRSGNGWILNGSKAWITNNDADFYVVMAKTDPKAGAKGISAFILPRDTEGLIVGTHENKSGLRGSTTGEISFDGVVLSADALLGELGMGFKYAMEALDGARISISAVSAGIAAHAMQIAKDYANERTAFGKPIAKHQGVMFKFADMSAQLRCMDLMMYDTCALKNAGKRCTIEAAQTKLLCTEWATQICLQAQQVLGGNGCSREFHVERLVRDAKVNEIAEGTSEIQRMLIGGTVLAAN